MAYGVILGQTPTAQNVTYNNSQTSSIITGTNVQSAIDQLFTSVSNGKELIANAITDKGVATSATDTFATMAQNIGEIKIDSNVALIKGESVYQVTTYTYNIDSNKSYIVTIVGTNSSSSAPELSSAIIQNGILNITIAGSQINIKYKITLDENILTIQNLFQYGICYSFYEIV